MNNNTVDFCFALLALGAVWLGFEYDNIFVIVGGIFVCLACIFIGRGGDDDGKD